MNRSDMKALWNKHGGSQHGPITETYTIEERAWYRFVEDLVRSSIATAVEAERWQDIASAPYDTPVLVKVVGFGEMTFAAILRRDASMTEDELPCDQWQAAEEGEHPPCWSGGACWEGNEDGSTSMQPIAWMPIPPAPTSTSEGEG